uniref:Uncharacterized protein n=1 Tax=viral metagenome TaxID=1070528 RepID=A0A6C0BES6_9ZZZZ
MKILYSVIFTLAPIIFGLKNSLRYGRSFKVYSNIPQNLKILNPFYSDSIQNEVLCFYKKQITIGDTKLMVENQINELQIKGSKNLYLDNVHLFLDINFNKVDDGNSSSTLKTINKYENTGTNKYYITSFKNTGNFAREKDKSEDVFNYKTKVNVKEWRDFLLSNYLNRIELQIIRRNVEIESIKFINQFQYVVIIKKIDNFSNQEDIIKIQVIDEKLSETDKLNKKRKYSHPLVPVSLDEYLENNPFSKNREVNKIEIIDYHQI